MNSFEQVELHLHIVCGAPVRRRWPLELRTTITTGHSCATKVYCCIQTDASIDNPVTYSMTDTSYDSVVVCYSWHSLWQAARLSTSGLTALKGNLAKSISPGKTMGSEPNSKEITRSTIIIGQDINYCCATSPLPKRDNWNSKNWTHRRLPQNTDQIKECWDLHHFQ